MSEELTIQGTLAETTVADLFRSLIRSNETAVVSLEAIGRNDRIFFSDGKIVFATSSEPDLGLAEGLLRGGEVNLHQYRSALEHTHESKSIGTVLCERGYLQPESLILALERQVANIVLHSLSFRSGSYTIEFTAEFPKEIISLQIATERLVMDGVLRIEYWSLIERAIGRMDLPLQQADDAGARSYHLDLTETENHIFSLLSEPLSAEQLCERSYLSNFETCRTLVALKTVSLVVQTEADSFDRRKEATRAEIELESEVEEYNAAFQKIYVLVFQEIGDHIYDFMDRVVTNMSPETLPYLSGINLINEGRVDFDQLLNNLISSGSVDQATVIHSLLSELLYGWIVEIREEFGSRLETPMSAIIDSLRR